MYTAWLPPTHARAHAFLTFARWYFYNLYRQSKNARICVYDKFPGTLRTPFYIYLFGMYSVFKCWSCFCPAAWPRSLKNIIIVKCVPNFDGILGIWCDKSATSKTHFLILVQVKGESIRLLVLIKLSRYILKILIQHSTTHYSLFNIEIAPFDLILWKIISFRKRFR